jgi:hypothetical protein
MPEDRIVTELALSLLSEQCIRNNIGVITNLMLNKIGSDQLVKMPIISEAGLVNKLKDAIGGIPGKLKTGLGSGAQTVSDMAANPQYAQQQLAASGASSNNERAAKQAVRILTDNLRGQFESKLSANGLTPDQITTTLASWKKLKPQADAGDQEALQQYNTAAETLKKAFKLFNMADGDGSGGFDPMTPETPPDAAGMGAGADPLAAGAPGSAPAPAPTPVEAELVNQADPAARLQARIPAIIAQLPNDLSMENAQGLWKLITGQSVDLDKFKAAAARYSMGNSIPKDKLVKAAQKVKASLAGKT